MKAFIAILGMAVALALSVPLHAGESEIQAVNAAADALDQAFERQDAKAIEELMTADHIAVTPYYGSPQSVSAQIGSLPELKYEQTNLDDPKVTLLGDDAALRTFSAELKGTFQGRPIPSPAFVASILVKGSDGQWREKFYQVTQLSTR